MAKREGTAKTAKGRRWDRRQTLIALVSIIIVLTMILSGFAVFFYSST